MRRSGHRDARARAPNGRCGARCPSSHRAGSWTGAGIAAGWSWVPRRAARHRVCHVRRSGNPRSLQGRHCSARMRTENPLTRAFSGRPARGIVNRFMREFEAPRRSRTILGVPFPLQNALTRPLRTAAAKQGAEQFYRSGRDRVCGWRVGSRQRSWSPDWSPKPRRRCAGSRDRTEWRRTRGLAGTPVGPHRTPGCPPGDESGPLVGLLHDLKRREADRVSSRCRLCTWDQAARSHRRSWFS